MNYAAFFGREFYSLSMHRAEVPVLQSSIFSPLPFFLSCDLGEMVRRLTQFFPEVSKILFTVFTKRWIRLWTLFRHPNFSATSVDTDISSLVLKSRVTTLKNIKEISYQRKPNKSPKLWPAGIIGDSYHSSLVKNIRSELVLFLSLVGTSWPPEVPSLPCLFHGKTQVTKLSESIQGTFAWNCLAQPQNLVNTD